MEWVANAIAVIFSAAGLVGWWRWMRSEMAHSGAPELAGVKRGFFLSIAALFVLLAGAMVPIFVVSEDDMMLGAGVGFGIILGGIVPVTIFMVLATTQFVRSEGREPVVLGPEARRSLRAPIAASIAGGFVVGTLTIWLVGQPPAAYDPLWVMIAALALTLGLVLWPLLAIHACANRERAARAAKASRAPTPPM
jgi:hypothetical protein